MPSIKKINASLEHHTVVVQDLDNWLIYQDSKGQLVGWISSPTLKAFEACKLNNAEGNRFSVMRGYDAYVSYQEALGFILGGE